MYRMSLQVQSAGSGVYLVHWFSSVVKSGIIAPFKGMGGSPIFHFWNRMPMDVRLLLENTLPGLGYELVDFELTPGGGFRVFIDKPGGITVEDCVSTSNHLTRLFMVENIDYDRLEVSSPGLDRPLKKEADYVRFQGSLAKVRTRLPVEQQKRFMGRIAGIQDSVLQLQLEDGRIVAIPLSNIDKARLEPEF